MKGIIDDGFYVRLDGRIGVWLRLYVGHILQVPEDNIRLRVERFRRRFCGLALFIFVIGRVVDDSPAAIGALLDLIKFGGVRARIWVVQMSVRKGQR